MRRNVDKAVPAALAGTDCGPFASPGGQGGAGEFPAGGCWERLLTIRDRPAGAYWLQLDSDTVTIGPVQEVQAAVDQRRSFIHFVGTYRHARTAYADATRRAIAALHPAS